ncbi:phosphotransacetylase family protein [Halococcus sp. PRR34]|uniref:phosphotransacetylase family protein n=1 Tax=Halococcus sp. PRR34 TaxID=3020830 RepID=UPI002361F8EF|nr:phosphotransacetylase family protein [Halococcus sp. PRR34]
MNPILFTSTDESTGKTAIALAVARIADESGVSAGYMKPKGTRLQSNVGKTLDEDPLLARELLDLDAEVHELEPVVYSQTLIESALRGQADGEELRERVTESYHGLADDRDLIVVEGGNRLSTGGIVDLTDRAVAELLDARVVLIAHHDEPGDVDDILAAVQQLDEIDGVLFNDVSDDDYDDVATDVIPFLEDQGIPVLGVVPHQRELAGITVADLADELGARVLTDEAPLDDLIERVTVGAMGPEAALGQFRRTRSAAMITGGDRPEIQTAALQASGVTCLLLTGGHSPPQAVLGRAEKAGVPVLLVPSDTITAVDRAEDAIDSGPARSADTVERMRSLLTDHLDVDTLLDLN